MTLKPLPSLEEPAPGTHCPRSVRSLIEMHQLGLHGLNPRMRCQLCRGSLPEKPCPTCGSDVTKRQKTFQLRKRAKFCGSECWAASARTSCVLTANDEAWIVVASGERVRISPEDVTFAATRSWHIDSVGYLACGGHGGRFHRMILLPIPRGFEVDHINHNQLDNRRENLRVVTHTVNLRNHKGHKSTALSASGINGVTLARGGFWRARITSHGKRIYLGSFQSREAAIEARIKGEQEHWGSER